MAIPADAGRSAKGAAMTPTPGPITARPARLARRATLALLLLAGCATTPSGPPVPMTAIPAAPAEAPFQPIGELLFSGGRSAAYSLHQVVGPSVTLAYSGDGKWAGTLDGRDVRLTASPGKLSGAGVNLFIVAEGDGIAVRGQWFQRQVSLAVGPRALSGRTGTSGLSYDLKRTAPNLWSGLTSRGAASVEARGDAQRVPAAALPQFVLALLAALP